MIVSFRDKKTQKLFTTDEYVANLDRIKKVAKRKLLMLHEANNLEYLRQFPNNHLEKLTGERVGEWAIRINDQYRLCFIWLNGNAYEVEVTKHYQKI